MQCRKGGRRAGGGDGCSSLVICLVDKDNSLSSFLARLSRFSWKETKGEGGEKLELIPSALYCAVILTIFALKSGYNREIRRGGGGEALYKPTTLYSTLSLSLSSPNIAFGASFTMLRVLSQVLNTQIFID